MTDFTMEFVRWPPGTTVKVYQRKSELRLDNQPPPLVAQPTSGVVDANGSVLLPSVPSGEWWAIAPDADGVFRYVALDVP